MLKAVDDSFLRATRKARLLDHKLVQIVSQKISAGGPSVPVEDPEERALRPVLFLSRVRLENVEDDGDPVLVVVPNDAFVRVGCVRSDQPVSLG